MALCYLIITLCSLSFSLALANREVLLPLKLPERLAYLKRSSARASEKAGVKNINYDRNLKDIARDKRYWETKRQSIRQQEKRLEELISQYEKEISGARDLRKEIIAKAKDEAETLLNDTNRIIENTIRQIRESQAEKEKTKEARQKLDEFKQAVGEEIKPVKTASEEKVARLARKVKKIKPAIVKSRKMIPEDI